MSVVTARSGRTAALVAAAILGGTLLTLSTIGIIPTIAGYFTDYWNGRADVITARLPFVESGAALESGPDAFYAGVLISSNEPLVIPRVLQATAAALGSLIVIVGSLLVLLLATRMLQGRSFTRLLRWGLTTVGLLVMATAAIAPQLETLAVDLAVVDLGYLIYGPDSPAVMVDSTPESIQLAQWHWLWVLDRVDLTAFLLGGIIAAVALLVADGERLQRDTEGLV